MYMPDYDGLSRQCDEILDGDPSPATEALVRDSRERIQRSKIRTEAFLNRPTPEDTGGNHLHFETREDET